MKEDEAYRWFLRARWRGGVPVCPECGVVGAVAVRRRRFRCRETACRREFSLTSGTILANRKLSFRTPLLALALSVHSVKGKAAAQLKRELGVDYKTAFVLLHKLREAVARLRRDMALDGVVEMDGMYVGGHVRPANRKDRRLAENQTGKRVAIMAMRERGGRNRTLAAAVPEERGDVVRHLARNHVAEDAGLRADQHRSYDALVGRATIVRNDHGRAYVENADASTNQAESFFSRARRAEIGIHHRIAGKYLDRHAAELAWREDRRRTDPRRMAKLWLGAALGSAVSRDMAGYWQRTDKAAQTLVGWTPMQGL